MIAAPCPDTAPSGAPRPPPHPLPDAETLRTEVPHRMQEARRWLLWRLVPNAAPAKRPRKIPFYADGTPRNGELDTPADLARLTTLDGALEALEAAPGAYAGLGFALGPDGPGNWQGIDLDHTDTRPEPAALVEMLPGYVERSPSGAGVHAVGYGPAFVTLGANGTCIEAYCRGRFFTVTGDAIGGGIADLSGFVEGTLLALHTVRPQAGDRPAATETADAATLRDLRSALFSMRADDRGLWVSMGHALHGLGDPGRGLWLEWSATSEKFEPMDAARTWDSFKPLHTGYQAVFAEAQRNGWVNPARRTEGPSGPPPPEAGDTGPWEDPSCSSFSAQGAYIWPEPKPLPVGLAPVEPFRFGLLPKAVRPWVQDICERVQCPPDYVGVSSMAALSAALGRKVAIRPQEQTDWTVIANQWGILVGRPGLLKSPAMEAALAPLKRLAAIACESHESAIRDHERDKVVAKLRKDAAEKRAAQMLAKDSKADVAALLEPDQIQEPTLRRYIANDPTAAALGELFRQNPNGLLLHRDEIASLLRALDREDNAEARGFYVTAWNGDSGYTFDRILRGMNLHIPAVCLSLLGSTQPGRLSRYIRQAVDGGEADDGLIQRFGLLVWPDASGEWKDVDRWPDTDARRQAFSAFDSMDKLDPTDAGAVQDEGFNGEPDGVPYLRFAADALGMFQEWRQGLESSLRSGDLHPAMESHLAKYRKLVPGLALLLHLADGQSGPVGKGPTTQALAWAQYLESHARRAYGAVTAPEVDAAKAILYRLRRGDLKPPFKGWEVYRPAWSGLTDREVVRDALQLLTELDYLRAEKRETDGRTATVYVVNPRAMT